MHTPQHNPSGYENSTITDVQALGQSVRFLVMHGNADDNVHLQNTLTLVDKLDLANIDNYDMQIYPDSDHSIFFHNGHTMVYERECILSRISIGLCCLLITCRSLELAHQCVQWRVASYRKSQA